MGEGDAEDSQPQVAFEDVKFVQGAPNDDMSSSPKPMEGVRLAKTISDVDVAESALH